MKAALSAYPLKRAQKPLRLRQTNGISPESLKVLGLILDGFMEMHTDSNSFYSASQDNEEQLEAENVRVRETLARDGLSYIRG